MSRLKLKRESGAALVVGLIMLILVTLMLLAALNLGTTNFRSVSNMQFRDEAIAAANLAIEQVITNNDFSAPPVADSIDVDLDDDGTPEYTVAIAPPVCVEASKSNQPLLSEESLGPSMSVTSNWNTVWDVDATVAEADNVGGATIRVHAGVRALLTQSQKNAACPG
jgi:hypothetical protein